MTPQELSAAVLRALSGLVDSGEVALAGGLPTSVDVTVPRPYAQGDYATNVALRVAGGTGLRPRELATALARELRPTRALAEVEVAGPGFLNLTLTPQARAALALQVSAAGRSYGRRVDAPDTAVEATGGAALHHDPDDPEAFRAAVHAEAVAALAGAAGITTPRVPARLGPCTLPSGATDADGSLRLALLRSPWWSALRVDRTDLHRGSVANPAYLVRFAHARAASALRQAADLGLAPAGAAELEPDLVADPTAGSLLRALGELPRVVDEAATAGEPHRLVAYLEQVADAFLDLFDATRVLPQGDERPTDLHRSRLLLVDAVRVVLSNGLDLLGVPAPMRM